MDALDELLSDIGKHDLDEWWFSLVHFPLDLALMCNDTMPMRRWRYDYHPGVREAVRL
jgi:hypothetical protein